jgi:hypothetical protein
MELRSSVCLGKNARGSNLRAERRRNRLIDLPNTTPEGVFPVLRDLGSPTRRQIFCGLGIFLFFLRPKKGGPPPQKNPEPPSYRILDQTAIRINRTLFRRSATISQPEH